MSDIYYTPQNYGLEMVGEIERSDACYQFDLVVVWKQARGQYWIGQDSGCSCPSPFEYVNDVNELDGPKRLLWIMEEDSPYTVLSKAEFKREISAILSRLS